MSLDQRTIDTYNRSATKLAEHFLGYQTDYLAELQRRIELAFELAGKPLEARAVEIGCGAGKDAPAIIKHCQWYEGFDPSSELLKIARRNTPEASFVQADALSYNYPPNLDAVVAIASMLHLNKTDFAAVCQKVNAALRPGGVFLMRLKEADKYTEKLQKDEFGERLFFLYNTEVVKQLAGPKFKLVHEHHELAGPKQKPWFTVILQKAD